MRVLSAVLLTLCMAMLLGIFAPNAKADLWDHKTIVTFDQPVEIPGQVLLPGTYVFSLENLVSDRDFVQIWSGDNMHLLATVLAVPASQNEPAEKSVFKLEERAPNSPKAIKDWFYPGDTLGLEFVYPPVLSNEPPHHSQPLGK